MTSLRRHPLPELGMTEMGQLSLVADQGLLYIHLKRNFDALNKGMLDLSRCYEIEKAELSRPVTGEYVAVKYPEDDCWYRGIVRGRSQGFFSVFFVDYGNEEDVEASRVRNLGPAFFALPYMALPCRLYGLKGAREWTDTDTTRVIAYFQARAARHTSADGANYTFCFSARAIDGTMEVDMSAAGEPPGTINKEVHLLLGDAPAPMRAPAPMHAPAPTARPSHMSSRAPQGAPARPQASAGSDRAVESLKLRGWTDFRRKGLQDVQISLVSHPGDFFLTFTGVERGIEALQAALNEFYNSPDRGKRYVMPATKMVKSHVCAAKYEGDWYRARILSVLPSGNVSVFYVDYGNVEEVPRSELMLLNAEFNAPVFGVRCKARGVTAPSTWPEESIDLLHNLMDVPLKAYFDTVSPDDNSSSVELLNLEPKDGADPAINAALRAILGQTESAGGSGDVSPWAPKPRASGLACPGLPCLDVPVSAGGWLDLLVSFVAGPSEIYAQLPENDQLILGLQARLQEDPARPDPATPLKKGSLVKAKYTDGHWYRGLITDVLREGLRVFMLDYGNTELVAPAAVAPLADALRDLGAQALCVSPMGATPLAGGKVDELRRVLDNSDIVAQVRRLSAAGDAYEADVFVSVRGAPASLSFPQLLRNL